MRHLPNLICLARIALIWPTLISLHDGRYALTLLLFGIAAISDGVDGFLAKRYQWTSEIGKFLDPLADKLLLVSMFIAASWLGIVPWWLAAASIGRDVMIGVGALIYRVWFGPLHGRPSIISKINTGMQIAYLILAIAAAAFSLPLPEILDVLALAAFVTTLASGIDYLALFVRRAWWLPADSR